MVAIMVVYLNYATSKHDIITHPVLQEMVTFVEAL